MASQMSAERLATPFPVLYERSVSLHVQSHALQRHARSLCLKSQRLREKNAELAFSNRYRSKQMAQRCFDLEIERIVEQVRELVATHPETRGRQVFPLRYRTGVYWCERV